MSEMDAIKITNQEKCWIEEILAEHLTGESVLVFGSRAGGAPHEHSDLDLAIKADDKLDLLVLAELREAFEMSDLPYRVDVMDFNRLSPEFQKIILSQSIQWKIKASL